jgi:hypothetical protein
MMKEEEKAETFLDYFAGIEDPRESWNQLYGVNEILFQTFCGVLSGTESWIDIESFGKSKVEFLRRYFPYRNGRPSDDAFRRFLER